MLETKGFKVTEKDKKITAIKKDTTIKAEIGSNVIEINGKNKYLPYVIWDIVDVANSI